MALCAHAASVDSASSWPGARPARENAIHNT